jgi:hypothetical protein
MLILIIDGYLNIFIDEYSIIKLNHNFNRCFRFIIHVTFKFKIICFIINQ